jgi:hypothetical protein
VVVVVDGVGTTVLNNTNVSPASVSSLSSGSLNYNTVYRWHIRAVNTTCGTDYGAWSAWGYFRFNRSPNFNPIDQTFRLRNSSSTLVAAETGARNQICQTAFMVSGSHDRRVRVEVRAIDPDGHADINRVFFRMGVGYSAGVINIASGSPTSLINGSGWSLYATPTVVGSGTSKVVTFPIEFNDNTPMNSSSLYNMEVRVEDIYGVSSGWVDTNRDFKVWNCQIPNQGTLYDSRSVAGAVCPTNIGYDIPYSGSLFTDLVYYKDSTSNPANNKTISVSSPNFSSGDNLIWGYSYLANFNSDLDMTDPRASQKIIDLGVGTTTCTPMGQFTINQSLVSAYENSPAMRFEYGGIKDQEPWYQGRGVSILGLNGVTSRVPVTCAHDTSCGEALTIDWSGQQNNGAVISNLVGYSSGCSWCGTGTCCRRGIDNDWYRSSYSQNIKTINYNTMYDELNGKTGVRTVTNWAGVTGSGGQGLVFVSGPLTITGNHTVLSGEFLLVVVNGSITINSNVTTLEGAYVASGGGITISGENATALTINGMIYATSDIVMDRGYENKSQNNTSPAVRVNMRPDLIFNAPSYLFERISYIR